MKRMRKAMAFLLLAFVLVPIVGFAGSAQAFATSVTSSSGKTSGGTSGSTNANKSTGGKTANGVFNTDEFEIRVVCGLDGNSRSGVSIPVTIYMKSLKDDFEGTVRLITPGSSDEGTDATAYEKAVNLTAGTQKVVTMSVLNTASISSLKFQLEDQKGKLLIDRNVMMNSRSNNNALVGVLSDDYTALNYFDGQGINVTDSYSGTSTLVELKQDTLPEQKSGLDALSYLIINGYDTSRLTKNQNDAIRYWVEQGGVLIIGTGSDYKQTLSAFQDDSFLTGSVKGAVKGSLELATGKGQAVSFTEQEGIMDLSLTDGTLLKGVLKQEGLIWNKDYGQGHIVVTAFNLGMKPVKDWSDNKSFASLLMEKSAAGYSATRLSNLNDGSGEDSWSLQQALDGLHNIKTPDMKLMMWMFIAFIVFSGPVLYLLLKIADKREWMWILVPVLSAAFTAAVFFINKDLRIDEPMEASVTSLYYDMDGKNLKSVSENVSMALQVPGAKEEVVHMDSSLYNLKMYGSLSDSMYSYSTGTSTRNYDYKAAVREGSQGYELALKNTATFASTYMAWNHVANDQQTCGLDLDLVRNSTGISGTVTNRTGHDLRCVSIFVKSRMVVIGDLKNGKSASFQESDNKLSVDYYDLYSLNIPGLSSSSREYNQIINVWNLFSNRYLYNMNQMDVYTYGYASDWTADYVTDEQVREDNAVMFIRHDSVGYSDYNDADVLNLYDYAVNVGDDWDIDGSMYVQTAEVEFNLSSQLTSVYALIRAKDSDAVNGPTRNTKVYAYNYQKKAYEELFTDGETLKFKKDCPYFNKNGKMKFKFTCNTVYEDYSPQITVIGGGIDAGY